MPPGVIDGGSFTFSALKLFFLAALAMVLHGVAKPQPPTFPDLAHGCPLSHTDLKSSIIGKKKPTAAKKGVGGRAVWQGVWIQLELDGLICLNLVMHWRYCCGTDSLTRLTACARDLEMSVFKRFLGQGGKVE